MIKKSSCLLTNIKKNSYFYQTRSSQTTHNLYGFMGYMKHYIFYLYIALWTHNKSAGKIGMFFWINIQITFYRYIVITTKTHSEYNAGQRIKTGVGEVTEVRARKHRFIKYLVLLRDKSSGHRACALRSTAIVLFEWYVSLLTEQAYIFVWDIDVKIVDISKTTCI